MWLNKISLIVVEEKMKSTKLSQELLRKYYRKYHRLKLNPLLHDYIQNDKSIV